MTVRPIGRWLTSARLRSSSAEAGAATDPALATFEPNAGIAAYVARYAAAAHEAESRPVGKISGPAPDPGPATEETALGNLIADAQLFATRDAGTTDVKEVASRQAGPLRAGETRHVTLRVRTAQGLGVTTRVVET